MYFTQARRAARGIIGVQLDLRSAIRNRKMHDRLQCVQEPLAQNITRIFPALFLQLFVDIISGPYQAPQKSVQG